MNVDQASTFFALLTAAANATVLSAVGLFVAGRVSPRIETFRSRALDAVAPSALAIAWIAALIATLGSLYYSEVAHFTPCELCWYQRIAMYPLAVVLGLAALRKDAGIRTYALPVVALGAAISIYHYQLERFPSQASLTCDVEAPCTLVWVWKFHYISIPFMALSAFALILMCLLVARRGAAP